jgi:hypothetical protein
MTTEDSLPLPTSTTPKFKYRIILDGSEYTLLFQWFAREGSGWHLSLYDKQDILLASNIKLVPWVELLVTSPIEGLPTGILGLACISQQYPLAPDITLDNLSTDFQLLYYSVT